MINRARWLLSPMSPMPYEERPMPYEEWRLWWGCRSVAGLADCTALWLKGLLSVQPGYRGMVDVDDAPALKEALILLNSSGVLTSNSQRGIVFGDWVQHAWVSGWATLGGLDTLARALPSGHDLIRRDWERRPVTVTYWHGVPCTVAGPFDPAEAYPGVHRAARRALSAAVQYDVVADRPGDNRLWPVLADALAVYAEVD